jgi:hypothetical protein
MFTILFWKATAERAIKSAAQGAVLAWGTVTYTSVGELVSATQAVGYAAVSLAVLSVLTSIASAKIGNDGPSLSVEELAHDVVTPDEPVGDH